MQVPQLPVTNIDFVASAWSPAGAGGAALPTCVMVGYNDNLGGIVRSTNGGGFWSAVPTGINTGLSTRVADVAAAPAGVPGSGTGTFIAVALSGDIYVSSNNGVSFVNQGAAAAALYGVTIGANGIAYAVGLTSTLPYATRVYRAFAFTSFSSWSDITANAPALAVLLTAVSSQDGQTVIAVGTSGTVLYSSNNGTTWVVSTSVPTTNTLQCVSAASASVAMAAGDGGALLLTTNGGQSWTDVSGGYSAAAAAAVGASPSFRYHAISMVSPTAAFAATSAGAIVRTVNQGATWALDYLLPVGTNGPQTILSLSMANGYTGVAGFSRGGRVVARTLEAPTGQPTTQPSCQPSNRPTSRPTTHPSGYDVTGRLTPTAVVWNPVATASAQNTFLGIAWAADGQTVVAVGYQASAGLIMRSTTGGRTWASGSVPVDVNLQFTDVAYYNATAASKVGAGG